ncbi:MAG: histidine--tRNA ligase, partial [Candidatus Omnitrophota bacterium]
MGFTPKYKALRGMPDILPEDAAIMRWVEERAREAFDRFGYREIRTPLVEQTEVFTRSIGEDTDIVEKEMYSFTDRGGKNISLRPEATASIIRAYIEHGMHAENDVTKLYYIGPMFRGERPQKGRQRQFYQIGAEIIGSSDPYVDAELILNLQALLKNIGINGFEILLNSLGCSSDRAPYKRELTKYLSEKKGKLCDDCVRRTGTNVLRVLDCKKKECRKVIEKAPSVLDHLCDKCRDDYEKVRA